MANPFVHVELATTDIDQAKSFYRSLFDWKLDDMDMGGGMTYTMIDVGEGTGGGMLKHPMGNAPSAWLPYVNVENIGAATAKAKSLGARVFRDYGGAQCRLVLDHRRPNRRNAGPVAAAEEVAMVNRLDGGPDFEKLKERLRQLPNGAM